MVKQKDLAEALGLSVRRIRDLEQIQVVNRQWTVGQNVQSYAKWRVQAATERLAPEDDDEISASVERAKLYRAQRAKVELEMAERRGELLPVEEIEKHWCNQVSRMRARLLVMPNKLACDIANAAALNPAGAEDLVRGVVYEALAELSESGTP